MTIDELYNEILQLVNPFGIFVLQWKKEQEYQWVNCFLQKLGCPEWKLRNCKVSLNPPPLCYISIKGCGTLFQKLGEADIEVAIHDKAKGRTIMGNPDFSITASVLYGELVYRLEDICELPPTPWNNGSTVGYRDSILQGMMLKDIMISISQRECCIKAHADISQCRAIAESVTEFPYGKEIFWNGEVENPGGDKKDVRIVMSSESFPCSCPPLYKKPDVPISSIKYAYIWVQTHCLDESLLYNYAVEKEGDECYVSCAYHGFSVNGSQGEERKGWKMHYALGSPGSRIEFYSDAVNYASYEGGSGVPMDSYICWLLGLKDGTLIGHIQKKLWELFFGEKKIPGNLAVFIMDRAMSISFRKEDNKHFVLEDIYFAMDVRSDFNFVDCRSGSWVIEGYLTEKSAEYGALQDFEMTATLYGADIYPTMAKEIAATILMKFPQNLMAQIEDAHKRFEIEKCYPLGQPPEEPPEGDGTLEEWSEGFSWLTSNPSLLPQAVRAGTGLKVSDFKCEGCLDEQEFYVRLTVDAGELLRFSIGELEVTVRKITGYINYTPQNTGLGVSGILRMGFSEQEAFDLFLGGSYESGGKGQAGIWSFEAGLANGAVSLSHIVNRIMGWKASFDLEVTAFHLSYCTRGTYAVLCTVSTKFPLFGGMAQISVSAQVRKDFPDKGASVTLAGEVSVQCFLFQVAVELHADSSKSYCFLLQLDGLLVEAVYEVPKALRLEGPPAEQKGGVLAVTLKNFTIGSLIRALFAVLRPNENFKLPKPWDILNRIGFPELKIVYDLGTGDVQVTLQVHIDLLLLKVEEVGFTYQNRKDGSGEKFNILVKYHWLLPVEEATEEDGLLEGGENVYLWDAFHSAAPDPMAERGGKKFKLQYFGIGRHIDLGLGTVRDMPLSGILDICKKNVGEEGDVPKNKYNAAYGWYVGAKFTLLEFLDVSLLFYDPVIYGLQAVVLNNDVVPLKGLDLTIYYRKVTEDVGLFYLHAGLPDCIRHMEFGMLSITLPSIEVWIYTNGNFKVNFGFPEGGDFSCCFALSYGIFYGRGGFYFGCLNGDTSASVPITSNGYFDPVIELGVGLTIGVGKSLNFGILKLRAELELTGVFEGVFAKFNPKDKSGPQMYYRCSGMVAIAGEISGEVNFFIIQAGFRIYARAALSAVLESGEATILAIEASFGVSAYVKIWVFKISFQFSFTYKDTFMLGKEEDRPWKGNAALQAEDGCVYDWTPKALYAQKIQAAAFLTPYYSRNNLQAGWNAPAASIHENAAGEEKIAVLAAMGEEDFAKLLQLLSLYCLGAQQRLDPGTVSKEQARELLDELGKDSCPAFAWEGISDLFSLNLSLAFQAAPCSLGDAEEERMAFLGGEEEKRAVPLPLPPVFRLSWLTRRQQEGEATFDRKDYDLASLDAAKKVFEEYVQLIAKCSLQKAVEYLDGCGETSVPLDSLLRCLDGKAAEIGGMASRFLLNGIRRGKKPLYDVICQQFAGLPRGVWEAGEIVHRLELVAGQDVPWLSRREAELSIAAGDLDYPEGELCIRIQSGPSRLPIDAWEPVVLALYDRQAVYQGDKPAFFVWKMPAQLQGLKGFEVRAWPSGELPEENGEALKYCCAALLDVTVCRGGDGDMYSILGASEETRTFLRAYQNRQRESKIKDVKILFSRGIKKSEEKKPLAAFSYDGDRNEGTWLLRQNLSEVTAAPRALDAAEEERDCAGLSGGGTEAFFALLGNMLRVGGEGHYLCVGGEPLESECFGDDGQAVLYFLLELEDCALANRILLCQDPGVSMVPAVQDEALGSRCLSIAKPGKIGFEMSVAGADEAVLRASRYRLETAKERQIFRENLTAQAFSLLYYCLDGEESLPISMQENGQAGEGTNYYSHILDVPHYPSPVPELAGMVNPYAGILPEGYAPGQQACRRELPITFYFADITGNSIGKEYGYAPEKPLSLAYADVLAAITEIPMTQVSYRMGKGASGRTFLLRLSIQCEEGESVERLRDRCRACALLGTEGEGSINLEPFGLAYYQYAQPDVALRLDVRFGEIYAKSLAWTAEQKASFVQYLSGLYAYAQGIREGGETPAPAPVELEFELDKGNLEEDLEELAIGKVFVRVLAKRDERYVEESSGLPRGVSSGEAGPDKEMERFCRGFEQAFSGGKVLIGQGIFAAFFPRDAVEVFPQDAGSLFFALLPFSTKLESRSGMEMTRLADRIAGKEAAYTESFLNIDLEEWMGRFLDFFECLLTPGSMDYMLTGTQKAGDVLNRLLGTKRKLAGALASRGQGVFLENGKCVPAPAEAQESLCGMMKKNLSRGYGAAGTAAYGQADKLGRFALAGDLCKIVGVEGAKVMPGREFLCFQATLEQGASGNTLSMESAALQFTHLEDQSTGEWYRFAEPFEQMQGYVSVELGHDKNKNPVKLPIPLRKYPAAPKLVQQEAAGEMTEPGKLSWKYAVSLDASLFSQDRVHVVLSSVQPGNLARCAAGEDLFACLAKFAYDENAYREFLTKPVQADENDARRARTASRQMPPEQLLAALEDFSDLAEEILEKCGHEPCGQGAALEFGFSFRCEFAGGRLCRVRFGADGEEYPQGLAYPILSVTDGAGRSADIALSAGSMAYEIPETISVEPGAAASYRFCIGQIPLGLCQGMRSEVYLKRNESFEVVPGDVQPQVNPGFVYETDRAGFQNLAHPCIRMAEVYDAGIFSIDAGTELLKKFIHPDAGLLTELTAWLGQRIQGSHIVYRPVAKRIKHGLSEASAKEFFTRAKAAWDGKGLEGKGRYFVRIGVTQFPRQGDAQEEKVVLVDADQIVFSL